ncbi:hypothetical protein AWZ03_015418, partial [Drosophila navojoa]
MPVRTATAIPHESRFATVRGRREQAPVGPTSLSLGADERTASGGPPRPASWERGRSSHRKELDDVLEGWPSYEKSRSRTEDDEERKALLSGPQNWTVRPEGTDLAEEVVELVKREAGACSRRHRRTRFKVTSEDGVYNVTVA